jgi:hypothetical protein
MKRETFKEVEVSERKFRIGRMDALTGSYITTLVLMQILPFGDSQVTGGNANSRSLMNKETFLDVQRECLKVVSELKSVGGNTAPLPVMLYDGRWGVEGLEDDTVAVMTLTIHTLIFNIADFFQGDALNNLIKPISDLTPFSARE